MTTLNGTEKQISYASAIKERLNKKLDSAIAEITSLIESEKELDATDEEIQNLIFNRRFGTMGDLHFKVAFNFAKMDKPPFGKAEKYIEILQLAQKHLNSLKSAKTIIDMATPETTTVFVAEVIKKIKFNK